MPMKTFDAVTTKRDAEKEYIEINLDDMKQDKLYYVDYQNETLAFKRISDDVLAAYDAMD